MFGLGMQELIIILVIALIIFGPRKLPELGRSLGKSIGEFKKASNELRNTIEDEIHAEETKTAAQAVSAPPAAAAPVTPTPPTDATVSRSASTGTGA